MNHPPGALPQPRRRSCRCWPRVGRGDPAGSGATRPRAREPGSPFLCSQSSGPACRALPKRNAKPPVCPEPGGWAHTLRPCKQPPCQVRVGPFLSGAPVPGKMYWDLLNHVSITCQRRYLFASFTRENHPGAQTLVHF